jgi:hypothetical protein
MSDPPAYFEGKNRLPSVVSINAIKPGSLPHDRHGAITTKIGDWKDYKRWAQTVREAWEEDKTKDL